MPDIELAASNEQCYTVKVGNELIDVKETQLIRYKGQILTGKQLYEQIHKVKPWRMVRTGVCTPCKRIITKESRLNAKLKQGE